MKKFVITLLSIVIVLGAAFGGASLYAKNEPNTNFAKKFNRYNPLIHDEKYYTKITANDGKDEDGYGNYSYNMTSYNAEGKPLKTSFTSVNNKLKAGTYMELTVHGKFVKVSKEIPASKVPNNIKNLLN